MQADGALEWDFVAEHAGKGVCSSYILDAQIWSMIAGLMYVRKNPVEKTAVWMIHLSAYTRQKILQVVKLDEVIRGRTIACATRRIFACLLHLCSRGVETLATSTSNWMHW